MLTSKLSESDYFYVSLYNYYLSHHPSINYNVRWLQHSKASHIWWLLRLFMFIKTTFKLNVFEEVQVVLFDLFVQMLTEQDTDTDINVSWYYLLQFNVHFSSHSDVTPSTFPSCKSILFPLIGLLLCEWKPQGQNFTQLKKKKIISYLPQIFEIRELTTSCKSFTRDGPIFFVRLYYMYFVFDYTTVRTIFTFLNWMHVLFLYIY